MNSIPLDPQHHPLDYGKMAALGVPALTVFSESCELAMPVKGENVAQITRGMIHRQIER